MSGLPSVSASWMAVLGRQTPQYSLSSQQEMIASAAAMFSWANSRAAPAASRSWSAAIVRNERLKSSACYSV